MLRRWPEQRGCEVSTINGRVYDGRDERVTDYLDEARLWRHPDSTIPGLRKIRPDVWMHPSAIVAKGTRFIGPAWVAAGHCLDDSSVVLGPAILLDAVNSEESSDANSAARPPAEVPSWDQIEPRQSYSGRPARQAVHAAQADC